MCVVNVREAVVFVCGALAEATLPCRTSDTQHTLLLVPGLRNRHCSIDCTSDEADGELERQLERWVREEPTRVVPTG